MEGTNYTGTYRSKNNMLAYLIFNQHYRERKLNEQRVKDKETDLRRREQEVRRMEGEYEQKLKIEMTKWETVQSIFFVSLHGRGFCGEGLFEKINAGIASTQWNSCFVFQIQSWRTG